jgi:phosphate transport system permease protein
VAVTTDTEPVSGPAPARAPRRVTDSTGRVTRSLLLVAAVLPTLALVFLAYEMVDSAWPSIVYNGWHFFTGRIFSLGGGGYTGTVVKKHGYAAASGSQFGVAPLIFGTVVASLIALVIAVPVSVGGALLLVERIPRRFQSTLSIFLELLAGIPSVVFGLWGVFTFGPIISRDVYRYIADLHIPWLRGTIHSNGQGLLTASLVLAVMIVPIIAATTRELIRSVPAVTREGAVALGLTPSETVRVVTIPYVRTGVLAAAILGWGRALGETIAVLLISGDVLNGYPTSIFASFSTMASSIAGELDGALSDSTHMGVHALAELGLVLLVITLASNFAGRLITRRLSGAALPVGRGV